jgi:hypothetical protein
MLHNNGIGGARAPHIRVELVSHKTVAIRIVGGIVVGVVQGIPGLKEVGEGLAGLVAAWQKALGFWGKRKHVEVQVSCSTINICNCKLFTSLAIHITRHSPHHLRFSPASQISQHLCLKVRVCVSPAFGRLGSLSSTPS